MKPPLLMSLPSSSLQNPSIYFDCLIIHISSSSDPSSLSSTLAGFLKENIDAILFRVACVVAKRTGSAATGGPALPGRPFALNTHIPIIVCE